MLYSEFRFAKCLIRCNTSKDKNTHFDRKNLDGVAECSATVKTQRCLSTKNIFADIMSTKIVATRIYGRRLAIEGYFSVARNK